METPLEQVLTSFYKEGMISYMESHPEDFKEAMILAVSNKQPYSWRAAWLLWSCMEENDQRIQPYIGEIIKAIPSLRDGHQRELIKILLFMDIAEGYEGILFDLCMTVWEKISSRPSVRYMAFRGIIKMAKKYPDLAHEISFLTQSYYLESLSPGIKNAVMIMVRDFDLP